MREKGVKFGESPKVRFSPMRSRCQNTVRRVGGLLEGVKVDFGRPAGEPLRNADKR